MEWLVHDIGYALRLFSKSPAFAAIVILLIAAGVSANTLIFSAIDALLLRPLPVPHPEQIVELAATTTNNWPQNTFTHAMYKGIRAKSKSFSGVFAQTDWDVALRGSGATERIAAQFVSGDYFSTLGIRAQRGRALTADDDRATSGAWPVVLSHGFWQRRFGGSLSVIGQSVLLQDLPAVVVGVLPSEFHGIEIDTSPDIRLPLAALPLITHMPLEDERMFDYLEVVGRLRPGASLTTAAAEWSTLLPALNQTLAAQRSDLSEKEKKELLQDRPRVESMATGASALRKQFSRALLLLMGGVGLLLLIVCANVASLLLARASARQKEIAMRLALGASSGRLLRQLLTESLLLSVIGGAVGFGVAYGCAPLLVRALPASHIPLAISIDPDFRVCAFTLAICLLTGIAFGLAPAFQFGRMDLNFALKAGPRAAASSRTGSLLVGAQVALCVVLLVGAGLLLRTLHNLKSADTGFNRDRVAFFTIDPGMAAYTPEQTRALRQRLKAEIERLPGVRSVSYSNVALMRGIGLKTTVAPAGQEAPRGEFLNTSLNTVSPDYFVTMGIPLLSGRGLNAGDSPDAKPRAVMVNEAFVRRFFPNQNPLGQRFGLGLREPAKPEQVIVGVVGDSKYRSLREELPPTFYTAMEGITRTAEDFVVHVRTSGDPRAVLPEIRRALAAVDSRLPMFDAKTMQQAVDNTLWQERLVAGLSSTFGALAALLAGMGLFGVLSYSVAQRTREFGIRMALGARPSHILGVVFVRVLWVTGAGLAAGFAAYYPVSRLLGNLLYRVQPLDPLSLICAALFILATAAVAGWWPARRAALVDPAIALREE